MDDESYFELHCSNMLSNSYCFGKSKENISIDNKFKFKTKFPEKVLVWIAISLNGHSDPFILEERTMNTKIYQEECIRKRLLPFIQNFHPNIPVIFWPDLASIHYAKKNNNSFR